MTHQKKYDLKVGRNLRRIRKQRGLMQIDVAVATGLDRTYISRAETGQVRTSFHTLCKFVKGLEITSADLIDNIALNYAVEEVSKEGGVNNGSKISHLG